MYNIIQEFVNSLIADGKSKCTVSSYELDVKEFARFSATILQKRIEDIKYTDLRKWVNNLESRGLSAQTRARKVTSIRSFFQYLSKMDYIHSKNPADQLESPKLPKKQPKVISSGEASCLLQCSKDGDFEKVTVFRDYTVMAMFLYTGIRREELTMIKLMDVNLENNTILIHGKGNKERVVYINDALHSVLSEYLMSYRNLLKTANISKYLFPSIKSEKLCVSSVNNIVNKAMDKAGIKEYGISAHILRKRFATTVFSNTGDIATTSMLLGHSSPTVTMRYVRIKEDTMRKATKNINF